MRIPLMNGAPGCQWPGLRRSMKMITTSAASGIRMDAKIISTMAMVKGYVLRS
jgi:hypothetical protein